MRGSGWLVEARWQSETRRHGLSFPSSVTGNHKLRVFFSQRKFPQQMDLDESKMMSTILKSQLVSITAFSTVGIGRYDGS